MLESNAQETANYIVTYYSFLYNEIEKHAIEIGIEINIQIQILMDIHGWQ